MTSQLEETHPDFHHVTGRLRVVTEPVGWLHGDRIIPFPEAMPSHSPLLVPGFRGDGSAMQSRSSATFMTAPSSQARAQASAPSAARHISR